MFPGDDIARLLPNQIKSLAEDLKKYPVEYPKWLYGTALAQVYQGDIIQSLTVVAVDDEGDTVSRAGPVVVMSHTCDAQPDQSDYVLVAPIFSLQERREASELNVQSLKDHLRDLCANRLTDLMFLPGVGKLPDSFIDFNHVSAVASEHFYSSEIDVRGQRIASLSQKGHYFFLMKLAFHFCRPDPPDSKRETGDAHPAARSTSRWESLLRSIRRHWNR